jgi:hypothetical protein
MNREIICRGKCKDYGDWHYGDLSRVFNDDGTVFTWWIEGRDEILRSVLPETIGWSTGRHDKNNVMIFEGDILKGVNGSINGVGMPFQHTVEWSNERCGFTMPEFGPHENWSHWYEVVGNIHDEEEKRMIKETQAQMRKEAKAKVNSAKG